MVNGDGTFSYTPTAGYSGSDSFTYRVSDGAGAFSLGTMTVAVGPSGNGSAAALNPADAGSGLTLGNGGATVAWPSSGAGWRGVRATEWSDSGQIYVEASGAISGPNQFVFGLASADYDVDAYGGMGANTWQYDLYNGRTVADGVHTSGYTAYVSGTHNVGMAVDFTARKAWFRVDGGAWQGSGDPLDGSAPSLTWTTGADLTVFISTFGGPFTVAFDSDAWAYTAPAGFSGLTSGMAVPTATDGNDSFTGDSGADSFDGRAGDDHLTGGGGDDTLTGGAGVDVLTGGDEDDLFIFSDGDGMDRISDFQSGAGTDDVLDLSGYTSVNDFAAVQARASQVGADTLIDLDDGDAITLFGVNVNDLIEDDFLF